MTRSIIQEDFLFVVFLLGRFLNDSVPQLEIVGISVSFGSFFWLRLNPLRTPKPLPILITSKFAPKTGFQL